jgi:hypothetical protein
VCFHQNFLFHFLLQYPNVEGPNSSVRCRHCGAQETLVPRDELQEVQTSVLQAMERMFDECRPISNSGVRHQHVPAAPHVKDSMKNSINGASAHSLQQGRSSLGRGLIPHVCFSAKHIQVIFAVLMIIVI